MKKIDMAQSFKNLGQWFKSIPQMDKKVLTLNIIKIICYLCTFPALLIATIVTCAKVAEGMTFYTFWPYIAAILVAVFGLIFGVVALVINRKKAKKRTIMEKTAILLVVCIILTAGIGLAFDIVLPDALAKATFGTLYAEDMYNRGYEESRVVEDYIHLFIGLNILNGNYDGDLYYETVKADPLTGITADAILNDKDFNIYVEDLDPESYKADPNKARMSAFDEYWFEKSDKYSELDVELYDFIYNHYVVLDYDYAFKNNATRKAYCLALVDVYSDTYEKLCKEGFKSNSLGALGCTGNEKLTQIYGQNYASQDMDGYIPINEDSGIAYVTNGRMTTPLIVRMFLNDSYTYTSPIYGEDGTTIVGFDGFLVYLYRPEIAAQYQGEYDENGRGKDIFQADDGKYYYAYQTGHVDTPYNWCILDLLGEPMPLAEINLDLASILGEEMNGVLSMVGGIGGLLDLQSENIEDLLEEGLTNRVVVTASNGQVLHLNIYLTDDGAIAATLYPQGMRDGYIGYQYMAWLEMGNLLLAVCGVVQSRNLLYIFGAISMVMILAVAFLDTHLAKRKEELALQVAEGGEVAEEYDECGDEDSEEVDEESSDESVDEDAVNEDALETEQAPVEEAETPEE